MEVLIPHYVYANICYMATARLYNLEDYHQFIPNHQTWALQGNFLHLRVWEIVVVTPLPELWRLLSPMNYSSHLWDSKSAWDPLAWYYTSHPLWNTKKFIEWVQYIAMVIWFVLNWRRESWGIIAQWNHRAPSDDFNYNSRVTHKPLT